MATNWITQITRAVRIAATLHLLALGFAPTDILALALVSVSVVVPTREAHEPLLFAYSEAA